MDISSDPVHILVVDDNAKNIQAATEVLQTETELVVSASSGAAALRSLMTGEYAVILLDVNMPDMDGFETASYIRQNPKTERTPIIFITAYDDGRDEVMRAYTLGAVDYMVKPYAPSILQCKVRVFVELYRMRKESIQQKELEQDLRAQVDLHNSIMSLKKLDNKYAERLFEPLARLVSTREYSGCGLGLATVEKMVRRHNGSIEAAGQLGKGAVFTVTLPVIN